MKKLTISIIGVMLLSVMGSLMASAQFAKHPAEPPQISQLANERGGNGAAFQEGALPPTGWVYVHAKNCQGFNGYVYLYTVEGSTFWTNDLVFQNVIETDCQFGNWIAFNITDGSGDWNSVFTWNYK
jgi:hypothetical protein